jgi:hypothetical protein
MDRVPSSEDPRVTWVTGPAREGPRELIGVLEVREDGTARAVLAQRVEVDGRCHVLLARRAWGGKDALETRWWSLVMRPDGRAATVRNGSCGDAVTSADVTRIARALESLGLHGEDTMIAVDDGPPAFPWLARRRR